MPALGLALLIVGVEYLARHFVLLWFPAIGRCGSTTCSSPGRPTSRSWRRSPRASSARQPPSAHRFGRRWQVWTALAGLGGCGGGGHRHRVPRPRRRTPLGRGQRSGSQEPWRWEGGLFASAAPLLVTVSLLLMNGRVVPLAEEWLWRGRIQPALVGAGGQLAGLLAASVLFSLKHVLIDASLGRLLALSGFGLVMGLIALRRGWRAAALAHASANSSATALTLLLSGGPA